MSERTLSIIMLALLAPVALSFSAVRSIPITPHYRRPLHTITTITAVFTLTRGIKLKETDNPSRD